MITALGSVYTRCYHLSCNDVRDPVLIENNGVAPGVTTPFWSNSIVFNQTSITRVNATTVLRSVSEN